MIYRYETHCHTSEASACSVISAAELAEFYCEAGYAGFCVTDHFSGNGTLPDDTPWKRKVDFFYETYKLAEAAGEKLGLSVFFGLEYSIASDIRHMRSNTGNDFLILNLSRKWLTDNREAFTLRTTELFAKIRGAGGFIIHAHPFNDRPWVEYIRLLPRSVDAVEIMNGTHSDFVNANAKMYAEAYGLLQTAGSDCHSPNIRVLGGVETEYPCRTASELITAIRNKTAIPFGRARK